jgi:hypothetical protein
MFLVANGAGTILYHVRLMQGVLLVTGLTSSVDRLKWDATIESITHYLHETPRAIRVWLRRYSFVTLPAIISERRVRRRDGSGGKKCLRPPSIIKQNYRHRAGAQNCADYQPHPPGSADPSIQREIGLITL